MSRATETHHLTGGRTTVTFLSAVIGIAAVGYFVGINDGVPHVDSGTAADSLLSNRSVDAAEIEPSSTAILATNYSEMRRRETGPTSQWNSRLDQIPQPKHDLFAEIKPSDADKQQSTLTRASRRAFNGAPPMIPHAIENTADAACYACHGKGMLIGQRVANRMSHGFLANCTQCHAPPPPKLFAAVDAAVENSFTGMPAPLKGERAFPGAPPTVPHSVWMRDQCLSCHGNETGWAGLQSTHPWRINCQQCHAPSAKLDQAIVADQIGFVPALNVTQE